MVHGPTVRSSVNGKYLQPHEFAVQTDGTTIETATGKPTTLTYEKMSKSKYNGVDPTVRCLCAERCRPPPATAP